MTCATCGVELVRDPFSGSRWEPGEDFVCPACDGGDMPKPSKYAVQYFSESRQTHVDIETLHTSHLAAAYRKLLALSETEKPTQFYPGAADHELIEAMVAELESRGATVVGNSIAWPERATEHRL